MADDTTKQWCEDRAHPFVTYNPWLGQSFCRCGARRAQGEQPQNMAAKREVFHSCKPGEPCRCYASARPVGA